MSYRIRYGAGKKPVWKWTAAGVFAGVLILCAAVTVPALERFSAGEGLYDALARYVGGMILGAG